MLLLATDPNFLQTIWFILIAVLWIGYLILEGFDYGVAMLLPILAKNEKEKRVMVNTIGPVWDGNQVWLLTAGGATFAAFPGWYATLFSGLYIPLFLILMGLIIRGVAFEYRAKNPETQWRNAFDWMATIGSFVVALVFGVGFANFVIGLPINAKHIYVGGFWGLFTPFALLGGIVLVVLFAFHGAIYLSLKTKGDIRVRARALANPLGLAAIGGGAIFLLWFQLAYPAGGIIGWILLVLAAAGLASAWFFIGKGREGIAFISSSAAIAVVAVMIFVRMFPNLGFDNSLAQGHPLNVVTAASTDSTLTLMLIAAVVFVPIVLGYTTWGYTRFRKRIGVENMPNEAPAAAHAG
ncbi:MAG: cytochrome d ubiquinol oxidase subunit II [Propionibacteriaceae bacterium]|jgi:cytochrome d ubiquinol oxidase subunit II|nr:cytochrome d ubiquinol oxidase subunit II [Micropruina sp.]HBX82527.1 cytochrome d ubiquinol oxidase subunit II [Propionibacteriaceae bacterium]HBY22330.1 cytochrome d ubiquinol oxidase subunit II [Propionibacteriaceae bacterium]